MAPITALLHTENDALRLGRTLETLYPCDNILIVDHNSRDATREIGRKYGATIVNAEPGTSPHQYLRSARPGWLLILDPREALTESLAASLFEWKSEELSATAGAFSVFLREETPEGWVDVPAAQTRLLPHTWAHWNGKRPVHESSAVALGGELLRFIFP